MSQVSWAIVLWLSSWFPSRSNRIAVFQSIGGWVLLGPMITVGHRFTWDASVGAPVVRNGNYIYSETTNDGRLFANRDSERASLLFPFSERIVGIGSDLHSVEQLRSFWDRTSSDKFVTSLGGMAGTSNWRFEELLDKLDVFSKNRRNRRCLALGGTLLVVPSTWSRYSHYWDRSCNADLLRLRDSESEKLRLPDFGRCVEIGGVTHSNKLIKWRPLRINWIVFIGREETNSGSFLKTWTASNRSPLQESSRTVEIGDG